ncbi:MAG: DNA repair protein RadC [Lachnospiraceae bacterium]|nr:DNA repair protein RadC [Lachnospiraceae bacterium]
MTIKETCKDLRPYEKFHNMGVEKLSNEELLAIIIRCGNRNEDSVTLAKKILSLRTEESSLLNIYQRSMEELKSIPGVGEVKAMQIKCVGELSRRIAKTSHAKRPVFSSPKTIANYFMEDFRHLSRERFLAVYVDTAMQYISEYEVSLGTVDRTIASPREIMMEGLRANAVHVILLHNHPSGKAKPSSEDIRLTKAVQKAGELIGITLVDHIIIADRDFYSFAEHE